MSQPENAACNCPSCQRSPAPVIRPGEAGYRFSDKSRSTGAIVPPEVACRCVGLCTGDLQPEDLVDPSKWCRHCGFLDPYSPCPRLGFGCGTAAAKDDDQRCDCCTPEQWKRAKDGT